MYAMYHREGRVGLQRIDLREREMVEEGAKEWVMQAMSLGIL